MTQTKLLFTGYNYNRLHAGVDFQLFERVSFASSYHGLMQPRSQGPLLLFPQIVE